MSNIKLYLAEDHTMFRKALSNMIKLFPLLCDIREAGSGRELLSMTEQEIPDVVIVDLDMPAMSGYKAVEWLKQNYPEVKVIGLTYYHKAEDVHKRLKRGADAFISKNTSPEELSQAIHTLVTGSRFTKPVTTYERLSYDPHDADTYTLKVELTEREYAIVELVCKEFTNKQIGHALRLSENTVRNHKVRIMRRAGVKNTPGLVKLAYQNAFSVRKRA